MTEIVNEYIVYDLDSWPRNLFINFILRNYLFGGSNIVITVVKVSMYIVTME